jgi:alpha-tubulin suppressor-like RCC1 family protein
MLRHMITTIMTFALLLPAGARAATLTFLAGANGTVSGATTQTVAPGGASTAVTALPNAGYYLLNWTGTGGFVATTSNPLTVSKVSSDQSITANFAAGTFDISSHGLSDAVAIRGGASHSMVLKSDGTVIAWGGIDGQSPAPAGVAPAVAIGAGVYHSLAVKSDHTVAAWGIYRDGTAAGAVASQVPAGLSGVTAVAGGYSHSVALKSNGTVIGWGDNSYGQITPPAGLGAVTAIAAGHYHTVALKSDGTVVAWGRNFEGQCDVPPGLSGVLAIDAKAYHTVALKSDGTVVAWGDNEFGQSDVPAGLSGVTAIAAGGHHTVALKGDGTVVAWGDDEFGQSSGPMALTGVTAIAAGTYHTLAMKGNIAVVGWGHNNSLQCNIPASVFRPLANGSVTCTPATVNYNGSSSCSILPSSGFRLSSFSVNGVDLFAGVSGNSLALSKIAASQSITALFANATLPTVLLSAPSSGSSFSAPASVALSAVATAGTGGTVSRVDFFAGGTLVASVNKSPFSTTWSNVAAGSYSLTAMVTDSLGATATSAAVGITVSANTAAPGVSITSPANGASFGAAVGISIAASATPGAGASVKQVDFLSGSTLIGTATTAPYQITWSPPAAGSYALTARVTDTAAGTALSAPVGITVTQSSLPAATATQDIGIVGAAGSASYLNGLYTLQGAGADIWGTSDAFRFVYQPMTGDGQIIARVSSLQNTSVFAKGGVMIRETLAANAAHAMMDVTPGNGAEFSRRTTTGASTSVTAVNGAAPYWVKLVRSGNSFTGYVSPDGVSWTAVGTDTVVMANSVFVGLIVSSHNDPQLNTATLDGVAVSQVSAGPAVLLTAPSSGATFTAPAQIVVTATASAAAGASVKQVDFYSGTTLLATALSAPYSITLANVAAGSYSLSAKVTDTLGGTATSAPVSISVTNTGTRFVFDTFTGGSTVTLDSHVGETGATWTRLVGNSTGFIDPVNGGAYSTGDVTYRASGTPASADYSVMATLHAFSVVSGTNMGVSGRIDLATNNRYAAYFVHGIGWRLIRILNGVETVLAVYAPTGADLVNGSSYTVELRMKGTAISMYINGQLGGSATDGSLTAAGFAGVELHGSGAGSAYELFDFQAL